MKYKALLFAILVVFMLSGCQEISISVQIPENPGVTTPTLHPMETQAVETGEGKEQQNQSAESLKTTIEPHSDTDEKSFDPYQYYFPNSALPSDIGFYTDNRKTFLVSYLESPGSLLGLAHVQEYLAYESDLFIAQDIIQSPIDIQPFMLHSGHNGNMYFPTEEKYALGEESVIYHGDDGISYRFYKSNMMVVVDVRGSHPWVTEEHAYQLAQLIEQKLPQSFPIPELIDSPPMDYDSTLSGQYLKDIQLVDCYPPHEITDPVVQTEMGYCFKTEVIDIIYNLKVGIYDKRYDKLVYMKEFLLVPQMGEWITGMFYPVWGYGWQHFHEGDYEALFWVNDQLVEIVPYSLIIDDKQN